MQSPPAPTITRQGKNSVVILCLQGAAWKAWLTSMLIQHRTDGSLVPEGSLPTSWLFPPGLHFLTQTRLHILVLDTLITKFANIFNFFSLLSELLAWQTYAATT